MKVICAIFLTFLLPKIELTSNEMNLLQRLVLAEAGGEGTVGMALVARATLNRTALVKTGTLSTGTYLAKGKSLEGVITGRNQYEPVSNGSINRSRSSGQMAKARAAIALARSTPSLIKALEGAGKKPDEVQKLIRATGFRTKTAFNDSSQNYDRVVFGNHVFNSDKFSRQKDVLSAFKQTYEADSSGQQEVPQDSAFQGNAKGQNQQPFGPQLNQNNSNSGQPASSPMRFSPGARALQNSNSNPSSGSNNFPSSGSNNFPGSSNQSGQNGQKQGGGFLDNLIKKVGDLFKGKKNKGNQSNQGNTNTGSSPVADDYAPTGGGPLGQRTPVRDDDPVTKSDPVDLNYPRKNEQPSPEDAEMEKGVRELQRRLGVKETGEFDQKTEDAVREWQRNSNLEETGRVDEETARTLPPDPGALPGTRTKGEAYYKGKEDGTIDLTRIDGKKICLDMARKFMAMQAAAKQDGVDLELKDGFRTRAEQVEYRRKLREEKKAAQKAQRAKKGKRKRICKALGRCGAKPGHSKHQSGEALDLNADQDDVYAWLKDNAKRFGFSQPSSKDRTHWEYKKPQTATK